MFITALPRDDTICFKHGGCPPTNRTGDEHAPLHDTTRLSRHGCPDTARPTRHGQHGKQDKHGRHGPRQPVQKEGPHGQLPPREARAARKDPDTAYTAPITARKDPDTAVPTRLTRPRSRHDPARHAGGGKPVCQGHWRHDWTSNTNTVFLTRSNAD